MAEHVEQEPPHRILIIWPEIDHFIQSMPTLARQPRSHLVFIFGPCHAQPTNVREILGFECATVDIWRSTLEALSPTLFNIQGMKQGGSQSPIGEIGRSDEDFMRNRSGAFQDFRVAQ